MVKWAIAVIPAVIILFAIFAVAVAVALQVAPLSIKAVLSSYTVSVAVCIPVSGWLADRYGTCWVSSAAIAVFTTGSLLCGISSDIHTLAAYRILQGMGGAMLVPVGRLTMVRTFPKRNDPLEWVGMVLFSSGVALLSYVLEGSRNTR